MDKQREQKIKEFFSTVQTGVITDAMNLLGLEGWMTDIYPIRPDKRLFGHAFTIKVSPIRSKEQVTYTLYDLCDKWNEGDIIVIDGMGTDCSLMGENVAHVCMYAGAGGAVLNGRCRDYADIRDMDMPVFSMGPTMKLRTKYLSFTDYNVPVNCAGAQVFPGDYILGDIDGVLVFPADRVDEIMYQAEMLLEVEKDMEIAIRNRVPISEIKKIISRKKTPRP